MISRLLKHPLFLALREYDCKSVEEYLAGYRGQAPDILFQLYPVQGFTSFFLLTACSAYRDLAILSVFQRWAKKTEDKVIRVAGKKPIKCDQISV